MYNRAGGLESAKVIIEMPQPPPGQQPPPVNGVPSWCICGKCRPMPTLDENKCCRQRLCVTLQPSFQSLVLDRDALSVATVGRMDVLADISDFSNEGYRFAAYRQYILWQNGYVIVRRTTLITVLIQLMSTQVTSTWTRTSSRDNNGIIT